MDGKMINTNYWYSRDGRVIEMTKMELSHFKNVVNYVFTEVMKYENYFLTPYMFKVKEECERRKLDIRSVLRDGIKEYLDTKGVLKVWDEETNQELSVN